MWKRVFFSLLRVSETWTASRLDSSSEVIKDEFWISSSTPLYKFSSINFSNSYNPLSFPNIVCACTLLSCSNYGFSLITISDNNCVSKLASEIVKLIIRTSSASSHEISGYLSSEVMKRLNSGLKKQKEFSILMVWPSLRSSSFQSISWRRRGTWEPMFSIRRVIPLVIDSWMVWMKVLWKGEITMSPGNSRLIHSLAWF